MTNNEHAQVAAILQKYPSRASSLIMVLQDIQASLNYLPQQAIDQVSEALAVPRSQIYSVASFYKSFSLTPLGKHKVDICVGTACHVRGADRLVNQLTEELAITPGQTSKDGEVTLNAVHCVGACALGPVAVIDGEYHGNLTPSKLSKAVKQCCGAHKKADESPTIDTHISKPKGLTLTRLGSCEEVEGLRERVLREFPLEMPSILVCAGTGCIANGSIKVAEAMAQVLATTESSATVSLGIKKTGCHGFCEKGPLVVMHPQGIFYTKVKPKDAQEIIETYLNDKGVVKRLLYKDTEETISFDSFEKIPFYAKQHRNVLHNIGKVDPEDLVDYIKHGGYTALTKALSEDNPIAIIDMVEESGLRGRGGGGFSTGKKWRSCLNAVGDKRYIICNGDEGDPGAFMDRSIMEGDPYAVLEGMTLAGYAVSASEAYIYVREEYPLAVERLEKALHIANQCGLLGENILGSDFSFSISINRGGGAFVCGESTALMQSIQGNIGEPRAKYIRSVERGLHDQPTILNNVETFASIPLIVRDGAEQFKAVGTEKSTGTKAFAVVGKVKNTGLVEVPMGTTLREIIFDICGGILDNRIFKAVQTGGPSGGCLPESKLDLPVDFDTLTKEGSMMGSGGMIVMDDRTCMVDVARYFTTFLTEESCGKCAACRLGLVNLKQILENICEGKGHEKDLLVMENLFDTLDKGALCGLGKSAANPVRSTLKHFHSEYLAHIEDKKCPAGVCRSLITYVIGPACTGCQLCAKVCSQKAISGQKKELHCIDTELCNRCGVCVATCNFNAIEVT